MFTIDFSAIAAAMPAMAFVIGMVSIIFSAVVVWRGRKENISRSAVIRAAKINGDDIAAELAALAASSKVLQKDLKTKDGELDKKIKEVDEVSETINKLLTAIANLSAKPASNVGEALTTLESLTASSVATLDSMCAQSPTFRGQIDDVRATGRGVKGIFDVPEKLVGMFNSSKAVQDAAILEKNRVEEEAKALKKKVESLTEQCDRLLKAISEIYAETAKIATAKQAAKAAGESNAAVAQVLKEANNRLFGLLQTISVNRPGGGKPSGGNKPTGSGGKPTDGKPAGDPDTKEKAA